MRAIVKDRFPLERRLELTAKRAFYLRLVGLALILELPSWTSETGNACNALRRDYEHSFPFGRLHMVGQLRIDSNER